MNFSQAQFETGASSAASFPVPDIPEVIFMGRSNVGKSSLLNSLTGKKELARVSNTPGRTRQINFFRIDNQVRFVDFPGYGYAKISMQERASWLKLMKMYLESDRPLTLIFLLIDSRLELQESDRAMIVWMVEKQLPLQIVLTKTDKLNQSERAKLGRKLLGAVRELGSGAELIPYSVKSGLGKKELHAVILNATRPM
jgi:GTP-binding protein